MQPDSKGPSPQSSARTFLKVTFAESEEELELKKLHSKDGKKDEYRTDFSHKS